MENEAIDWIESWLSFNLKNYQKDLVKACVENQRVAALFPRQSGKSTTIATYVIYKAMTNNDFNILIISKSLHQSSELFNKIRNFIEKNEIIDEYVERKTQTEILFKNRSKMRCLPTGPFGDTILGYTANLLIIDESGVIKDEIVNRVLLPMVIATQGQVIKIGTPRGKNHFYESCYGEHSNYKLIHIDWRKCVEEGLYRMEEIEEYMHTLTDLEFNCEFESRFMEIADCFFPQALIDSIVDEGYPMMQGVY